MNVSLRNNTAANRYEISVGAEVVAFLDYERRGTSLALNHTETDPRFRGRGLADKLLHHVLSDARDEKLVVEPHCSFVHAFIERHPEFAALVS